MSHERERALRREVGPSAWAVLADLCLDARADDSGVPVVATSARRAALNVGIGKDAAARALRRLIGAGVLSRRPQASNADGRFTHIIYELRLGPPAPPLRPPEPDTVDHPCPGATDTGTNEMARMSALSGTGSAKVSSPRKTRAVANQLSFLDAAINARESSWEAT